MSWSSLQPHATRAEALKIARVIGVQGYPGRAVHGENWPKHGREFIFAQSDSRTETSAQLTQAEVDRIISLLRQEQQEAA